MIRMDDGVKELARKYNRVSLLFFLMLAMIQLVLAFIVKSNQSAIEAVVAIEAFAVGLVGLCAYAARPRVSSIGAAGASLEQLVEAHREIGALIENTEALIMQISPLGTVQWVSQTCESVLGLKSQTVIGEAFQSYFVETAGERFGQSFEKILRDKGKIVLENQDVLWPMGQRMIMTVAMIYLEDCGLGHVLWIGQDKSAERNALQANQGMAQLNALLMSDIGASLYFDRVLRELVSLMPYADCSHLLLENGEGLLKVKAQTGYSPISAKEYALEIKESLFFKHCGKHFQRSVIVDAQSLENERKEAVVLQNDLDKPMQSLISCPIRVDGKLIGLINVESSAKDAFKPSDRDLMDFAGHQASKVVSVSQWIEQGIYHSKYDALTGLYNRWQLDEFERSTLPRCARYKEPFLFVSMVLSHLQEINDHYGHQTGDLYLMTFAKLLKAYSRETDLVFRMGGDQFVGIFFTSDAFTLSGKLEMLEQSLAQDMNGTAVIDVPCHFAYGIAAFPEEGQGILEIYTLADQRMKEKASEMKTDVRYKNY